MQILRVELENIKSYEHATVDLRPASNAIMGHNGASKSTLLEAIGFALFDNLPYNSKDFLRQGARARHGGCHLYRQSGRAPLSHRAPCGRFAPVCRLRCGIAGEAV